MAARKGAAGRPERVAQRQAAGEGVRTQLRQVRRDGWAQKDRARFLAELAETCNVSEAARTVGKSRQAAYGLKQRDAEFARDWAIFGFNVRPLFLCARALHRSVMGRA
ncbi:hypothetical protein [Sphingobium yanoikuyae]|jgi:hypothetical protein|uniref:hypothetical protein n=1 Tax=Sphingobium yanoikuyae TaxID=13690 RepID=UPI003EFC033D